MIEISELFSDPDFAQPFQIERLGAGSFSEGEYTPGSKTTLNVVGVIQPAKDGEILLVAQEGERQNNWIAIWLNQEIRDGDGDTRMSDYVIWQGDRYRVAKSKPWQTQGYWRAWAQGLPNGQP